MNNGFLAGDDSTIEIERNDTSMYKLEVPEDKYEQLTLYRDRVGTPTEESYWKEYIRDWKATLSPLGLTAYYRFLEGDDSAIVVKTEPSPTIKDSLESLANKVDDIGDVIKAVIKNLEKEVIPDNDPEFIIRFVMFNESTREVTTKYVSRIVSGKVSLSHWAHEALIFSDKDDAVTLIEDLNESIGRVGLLKNSHFQLDYWV